MIYKAHMGMSLILIAMAVGVWVLVRLAREEGPYRWIAKAAGFIIVIVSLLMLLCSGYHTIRYWEDGAFRSPGWGRMMGAAPCPMMGKMGEMIPGGKMEMRMQREEEREGPGRKRGGMKEHHRRPGKPDMPAGQ